MSQTLRHQGSIIRVNMSQEQQETTRRGVVLHTENPFMAGANVATRTRRVTNKRGDMMLVSNEGELVSQIAGFWEAEEVDSTKFLKLFVNGVRALAELSNPGARVFELLYIEMQNNIGKDQVYLSFTGIEGETKISRATFKRGMAELIDKKFLAAMPAVGWYWVNPDFIWNGDRLAFVKEYRKAGSAKKAIERDTRTLDLFGEQAAQ